ncbi:MAG: hypothetical protein AMJ38_05455 [Dehalococcoidia bacterium DG_22]|nr:MAG: hypothetical protein AMJ38_05455 [Dehalococcoidia bacterium DG_22]
MASINLRVTPSASRDALMGWQGDVLRLRVTAPAQRGKANEAILRLLAAALRIERRRLRIVRGEASRQKVVFVDGLDEAEVRARLGEPPPGLRP